MRRFSIVYNPQRPSPVSDAVEHAAVYANNEWEAASWFYEHHTTGYILSIVALPEGRPVLLSRKTVEQVLSEFRKSANL